MAALVVTLFENEGAGRLNSLESCFYKQYLTLKVRLNDTAIGLGKLDKTQRNIGLLCAVLKVRS